MITKQPVDMSAVNGVQKPEDVRVTMSWLRIVGFNQSYYPNGTVIITLKIVNGEPVTIEETPKVSVRADKKGGVPGIPF